MELQTQEKLKWGSRVFEWQIGENQGKDFSLVVKVNW